MKILITGGAGYIGSHAVLKLVAAGHEPVIVDNFTNSNPKVLDRIKRLAGKEIPAHHVDIGDKPALTAVFELEKPQAVIHLAGYKAVGESVQQPLRYYRNNLDSTLTLLEVMREAGVQQLIFSSTAAIYGPNAVNPLGENSPLEPLNPYATSKLMIENILRDYSVAEPDARVIILRFFNPVGAHPSGMIGEDSGDAPNNLLPYVAKVAVGKQPYLEIFGNDYATPDGTCRRDFLHVEDLATAQVQAIRHIQNLHGIATYNLGTGIPYSVLEIVKAFEEAAGKPIAFKFGPRRPGDVAEIWAQATKAQQELGWKAAHSLKEMCADMWRFQSHNPDGYNT